jgi:hypothetical protein
MRLNLLDKLFGLDIVHAVDTCNTITVVIETLATDCSTGMRSTLGVVVDQERFPLETYPTERTRPVSAKPASSWTPRILCSRMEETSVGVAFASANVRTCFDAALKAAGAAVRPYERIDVSRKAEKTGRKLLKLVNSSQPSTSISPASQLRSMRDVSMDLDRMEL